MARARPLQCPFCETSLRAPIDIRIRDLEVTGGICTCGAVYALDRTGHNVGDIFMDALTFLSRGDVDRALSLGPEDYESAEYDYDIHGNTIGRRSKTGKIGKLVFLRMTRK